MSKRAALYLRVSTDRQSEEGFSLAAQEQRLEAFTRAQGWEIAAVYRDEGHSGRTPDRPAYRKMMEDAESWDTLLVLKMDRVHRSSKNMMQMMEDLREQGKEFASVTESLDTGSAMGRFVMSIIASIAQLESEQIGERVTIGMEQKAKSGGGWLGGPAPFGYTLEGSVLVPHPMESGTVRMAYEFAHREGITVPQITARFNGKGLPTRTGAKWSRHTVRRMLTNPVYAGCIRWVDTLQCGQHEGIVSVDLFNTVQRHLGTQEIET